jgi:hypothetical protein
MIGRHAAREHRRRLMQGLGRPIMSWEDHGYRLIAIGSEIRWSKGWLTFPDFLFVYITTVLTPEWGNAELGKSEEKRHPLLRWYQKLCAFQQAQAGSRKGEIYTATMTGAVRAYLGLAYDLYLSAHNAELPDRLLKRLRNRDQFEGALYEAFVIGCFARAGFDIAFENEDDSSTSHCEFTATHKETKRQFSVEAKAVTSASKRAGASAEVPKIRGQLVEALRKDATHPRIVFIELSRAHGTNDQGAPEWVPHVAEEIARCEQEITIAGAPPPAAYVFVTNRAFVHDLDGTDGVELWAAGGFKIEDFPPGRNTRSILELHRARQRHIEIHWLMKALERHGTIPTTFDDRLPEEAFDDQSEIQLRIGETYLVLDASGKEVPGVLVDAIVMPPERAAQGIYRLASGEQIHCTVPLTDAEMSAYARSPETFFGTLKHVGGQIKEPLDAFDFVHETYSRTPREKLLAFMAGWPKQEELRTLDQPALAEQYAAGVATQMWDDIVNGRTKLSRD